MATPKEYIDSILTAIKELAALEEKHPLIFSRKEDMLKNLDTEAWATLEALQEIIEEG
jgi:hypothetical protein